VSAPILPKIRLTYAEMVRLDSFDWNFEIVPPNTTCKHHEGTCDRCGTSDLVDAKHTTVAGRGSVARLRARREK
jgi:hypothetical protein